MKRALESTELLIRTTGEVMQTLSGYGRNNHIRRTVQNQKRRFQMRQ